MKRTASQNGKRSRTKGAAFEREVATRLRAIYPDAERNIAQSRTAAREGCDVERTPWWIECKVGAAINLTAALSQAVYDRDRKGDDRPVLVIAKRDRRQPVVYAALSRLAPALGFVAPGHGVVAFVTMDFGVFVCEVSVEQRHRIARAAP